MFKKKVRVVAELRETVSGVQCNSCGRSIDIEGGLGGCDDGSQEFHEFTVAGSYSSKFPADMTRISWVMCADCLQALVGNFAVPPEEEGFYARAKTVTATHSGTGEKLQIYKHLAFSNDEFLQEDTSIQADQDLLFSFEWPPYKAAYRHYKGRLYTMIGACLRARTNEPLVVYQELFGESRCWVRPLAEWFEVVSEEGEKKFRFTGVSLQWVTP